MPRALPSVIKWYAKGHYVLTLRAEKNALDRSFFTQPADELPARYREPIMRRTYTVIRIP